MEAESLDAVVSAQCLELKQGTDFSTRHGSEQISSFATPVPTQRNDWHKPGRKLEGWETPFRSLPEAQAPFGPLPANENPPTQGMGVGARRQGNDKTIQCLPSGHFNTCQKSQHWKTENIRFTVAMRNRGSEIW